MTVFICMAVLSSCGQPRSAQKFVMAKPTPCDRGNSFVQNWQACGAVEHETIIPIMLGNELHLFYNFRHGKPYDVVDARTGKHYFVDVRHALLKTNSNDTGMFYLTLTDRASRRYILRWKIVGEFDKYLGSSPNFRCATTKSGAC